MSTGRLVLTASEIHEVSTVKQHVLGAVAETRDGRVYRYAKNGGTALAAGATVEASATANYTSTVVGSNKVADGVVRTAGTVTAGNVPKYEDGILTVKGAQHLVNGVAQDGTISLQDKLAVPLANGDATTLKANQFNGVAAGATTPIGAATVAVPANAYFWAFVSL
jgi:hypothetical protein